MPNNKASIDRIEDGIAVLEFIDSEEKIEMPLSELPETAREGDVLEIAETGELLIDTDETARIRRQNYDLFKSLLENPD